MASDILLKRLRMIVEAESVNIRGAIYKGNIYFKGIIIMKNYRKKNIMDLGKIIEFCDILNRRNFYYWDPRFLPRKNLIPFLLSETN